MRISRIHTEQALAPGERARLDERTGHYLARVLKLRVGDPLVLFNGDGADYAGEIESMARSGPVVIVNSRLPAVAESPLALTLVQAISRGERMDQTVQKATELGVAAIQPVFTQRVEVRLDGARLEKRMRHWRGVVISACEQCGRAILPRFEEPVDLSSWLAQPGSALRLALDPAADRNLSGLTLKEREISLLVGPEGGLTDQEREQLDQAGALGVRMGPRVLRTETAGPAAIAALQALAGDF
jgi:16S rRNA (uracil1498-N3)-methyltransferase